MAVGLKTRRQWIGAVTGLLLLPGCYGASELTQDGVPLQGEAPPAIVEPPVPLPGECEDYSVDPFRVTAHRLNRAEYDNTVRDLLGDTTRPAQDFPADDHGYGFDNNADVLSLSPLLMEKYEAAAEKLVSEAWDRDFHPAMTTRIEAESATGTAGAATSTSWNLYSNGNVSAPLRLERNGTYTLRARAWGTRAGTDLPKMELRIDGALIATFNVDALSGAPKVYTATAELTAGQRTFSVHFTNDFTDSANADPALRDRNLQVDWFEAHLPKQGDLTTARLRVCEPSDSSEDACARTILQTFANRAWRRPVTDDELTRLTGLLALARTHGDGFDVGVKLGLKAILLSPHFLFRFELDPDPTSTEPRGLNGYELASRLSYFLWSSTPDDALLSLASTGELTHPAVLEQQVLRMLADPRASALIDNFAGQWLQTRAVESIEPNTTLFPDFDPALKDAFRRETELVFKDFLTENRPVRDLFVTDFTYVNDTLAAHYGLPLPGSSEMTRVSLSSDSRRGGILTHGSFLALTSHPDRTSPVKRGKWVLTQLLCNEPPAPPPGVENLAESGELTGTLRERFEQHRADPACAGCHAMMDPIGFGLENFDAAGKWRTEDEGHPIDSSGLLPTGGTFSGAAELGEILRTDPGLAACVSKHLMVFALGRGNRLEDQCALATLGNEAETRGGKLVDYIQVLVQSELFRMRRAGDL